MVCEFAGIHQTPNVGNQGRDFGRVDVLLQHKHTEPRYTTHLGMIYNTHRIHVWYIYLHLP